MAKPTPRPSARRTNARAVQVRSIRRPVTSFGSFACCFACMASLCFGNRGDVDDLAWKWVSSDWDESGEPSGIHLSATVQEPVCASVCERVCRDYPIAASTGFSSRAFLQCIEGHGSNASGQSMLPTEEARSLQARMTDHLLDALKSNSSSDHSRYLYYKHVKMVQDDPLLSHLFDIEASLQHQQAEVLRVRQGGVTFYEPGDPAIEKHNLGRPAAVRQLAEWIRDNGGTVNDLVAIESASEAKVADSGEGGVVLRARGHIRKFSIVVSLPYFMLLTSKAVLSQNPVLQHLYRKFYAEKWIHNEDLHLVLALMFDHKYQGLDFTPYYKTLPAHLGSVPLLWPEVTDFAIELLRRESPFADISNFDHQTLQPRHEDGRDHRHRKGTRKQMEARLEARLKTSLNESGIPLTNMEHVKDTLIKTEMGNRQTYTKLALAVGGYYKDKLEAAGIPFSSLPDPVRKRGLLYLLPSYTTFLSATAFVGSRNFGDMLMPLLDMCIHDGQDPNVDYGNAKDMNTYMLRAKRDVQAGEILRFDYRLASAIPYWLNHGFVPPGVQKQSDGRATAPL
uniref:SET domain-containing protein n=1 Tax=Zooxanthella nutricula TaxID=1333877 RepID=A0A7S2J5R8_9DINO